MGKWLSPDVIALCVPIAGAMALFFNMQRRAFMVDPEWSNGMEFYESDRSQQLGHSYKTQYRQFFEHGVKDPNAMSWIFNNEPKTRQ